MSASSSPSIPPSELLGRTSEPTRHTSSSAMPHTPGTTPTLTRGPSSSSDDDTFDPNSSADRLLARTAGIRVDTPTPYPRLLLEMHIGIRLDRTRDPEKTDRIAAALQSRHGSAIRIRYSPDPSPESTARRIAARKHRKANPITRRPDSPDAFLASIAGPPPGSVALPPSYLATANNTLTPAQITALSDAPVPPLFVYGHWMFPAQMAGALGSRTVDDKTVKMWARRMLPAVLEGWNRYCIRGRSPTPAVLEHGSTKLRYYIRDVVEQDGVEGRLVLGLAKEQMEQLDAFLEVQPPDADVPAEERVWGRREVQVGVEVEGVEGLAKVKAFAYVWEGDALDLHIFKQDKVWTPELYVDWYLKARREMTKAKKNDHDDPE